MLLNFLTANCSFGEFVLPGDRLLERATASFPIGLSLPLLLSTYVPDLSRNIANSEILTALL